MSSHQLPSVLLVDDNEETCTLVKALLRREFSVETAHEGAEAIELLRTKSFGAVLLDLRMPNIDGFGVLDHLATNRPEVLRRIIVLTASLTVSDVERVNRYAVFDLIRKPFDVDVLLSAVRRCASNGDSSLAPLISAGMLPVLARLLRDRFLL